MPTVMAETTPAVALGEEVREAMEVDPPRPIRGAGHRVSDPQVAHRDPRTAGEGLFQPRIHFL